MPRFPDQKEIERLYYEQLRKEWIVRREKRLSRNFKVFVSYSREDQVHVAPLLKLLEDKNIRHFLDEKKIEWGDSIPGTIESEMEKATHLLFCLSPRSHKSKWCIREYELVLDKDVKRLVFMLQENYLPPSYAKAELATDDIRKAEEYFSRVFVDEDEVQFFLDNDLFKNFAKLASFVRDPDYEHSWTLDEQVKSKSWVFQRSVFMDSAPSHPIFELIKIGVDDFSSDPVLDLEYGLKIYQTITKLYILKYVRNYRAVMVHKPGRGNALELDQTTKYYTEEDVPLNHFDKFETPEAGDTRYWGWGMSEDFWAAIIRRLVERMAKTGGSTS
jgi:nitroimidazol reductase NimA-like FMN-containing flavoprotein (pyridoxamine 5'-phosphate oxidase superfamily)